MARRDEGRIIARDKLQSSELVQASVKHVSPLSLSTIVVRSGGLIEAEIENEIVALNIEKGTCYGLNRVGSRIWRLLADPIRIGDVCAQMLAEYKVATSACERQVLDLLEELHAEGLITITKKK